MLSGTYKAEPDIDVAKIEGRMTLGSNLMFLEGDLKKLVEGGSRALVLDLSELSYVDSAGLGVLVGTAGLLRSVSGRFAVFGLQKRVEQIFGIAKINRVIPVFPDVDAALGFMRSPAQEEA